jgi:predicted nucleotidyltransferase
MSTESIQALLDRLGVSAEQLADFCRRYSIVEFAVFGSAARDEMRPDSDVDVMIEFAPGTELGPWMGLYFDAKDELEKLLHRPVDLIQKVPIRNPFVRRSIAKDLQVLYAA